MVCLNIHVAANCVCCTVKIRDVFKTCQEITFCDPFETNYKENFNFDKCEKKLALTLGPDFGLLLSTFLTTRNNFIR